MDAYTQKGQVLVVEDYEPNQDVARMHLEGAGYTVTVVSDGEKAVRACKQDHFDLILMDLQMPVMDGYAATRKIRQEKSLCSSVPIVAVTANANKSAREMCTDAGINDILTKPFRRKGLLRTLVKWLGDDEAKAAMQWEEEGDVDPETNDECIYDADEALRQFGNNRKMLATVVKRFIKGLPDQIQKMKEAADINDADTIEAEAHKIKGGAANLLAMPLSRIAETIEDAAENSSLDGMSEYVDTLDVEFQKLKKYIEESRRD